MQTLATMRDLAYRQAFAECDGRVARVAAMLGVEKATALSHLRRLGLVAEASRYAPKAEQAQTRTLLQRLAQGPVPYFGSPAQQELMLSGAAKITHIDGSDYLVAATRVKAATCGK